MRALMAASSIGILIGASVGSAYLGGKLARDTTARHVAGRLIQMASLDKSGDKTRLFDDGHAINPTAMDIALRFSDYAGTTDQNVLTAQNLTAMRISDDMRVQRGLPAAQVVRASMTTLTPTPVRAAEAFAFRNHSQNDSDCLTQAVYYEARGEGVDGMRAVAQVILNRVRHPAYPKTVCGVVYQGGYQRAGCQFSFVCNGAMSRPVEAWAWRRAKSVADAALNGYVMTSVGTATSFHVAGINTGWDDTMQRVAQIGSHIFYQFRGRGAHIGDGDNVMPSDSVPQVTEATDTTVSTPDAPIPYAATPAPAGQNAPKAEVPVAKPAPKPVTVSAQITGRSAQDIIDAVSVAPTKTSATAAPAPLRP